MRRILQKLSPVVAFGIAAGVEVSDVQSNVLAYTLWIIAAAWALYVYWPWIKRWRPWTLAPASDDGRAIDDEELKRRCIRLAEELTKFLDAWENYRDGPKIFPEKPGDWPRYTMEQYRDKLEPGLVGILDDLERQGWLTAEAHAHFELPTDDPQKIREAAARLRSICRRH